jgi:hypothetical protein
MMQQQQQAYLELGEMSRTSSTTGSHNSSSLTVKFESPSLLTPPLLLE